MLLKEYVEMVELNEGTTIEETLTELIDDLRGFVKANDDEESKETLKAIIKYVQKNVLKVGRVESSRLIEKAVAERLEKIFTTVAKKLEVEVPADVEERIEHSVSGKAIEKEEETTTKRKNKESYDNDEQIKKERESKKKDEEEEKEAHKGLEHEEDADVDTASERAKNLEKRQATKKRKTKDDDFSDVDAFIAKVTHKK